MLALQLGLGRVGGGGGAEKLKTGESTSHRFQVLLTWVECKYECHDLSHAIFPLR